MNRLVCNSNSRFHIDYGVPIVANKSTDYRTTTGTFHDYIPDNPQDFDCRVKLKLKDYLKYSDVKLKEVGYATRNRDDYRRICSRPKVTEDHPRACGPKDYMRNVYEKYLPTDLKPIHESISEAKEEYDIRYPTREPRKVIPPAISAICEIKAMGRDEQPRIPPEKAGYWKHLDPYMSTYIKEYIPFTKDQYKVAKQDFPTFYNTNGKHPGFDGIIPPRTGNRPMTGLLPNRILPKVPKSVPHSGMCSEYSGEYSMEKYLKSDLLPFIHEPGEEFEDSIPEPSPMQCTIAPAMYRTEYNEIGSGKSARNVFGMDVKPKGFVHEPCQFKFTDQCKY